MAEHRPVRRKKRSFSRVAGWPTLARPVGDVLDVAAGRVLVRGLVVRWHAYMVGRSARYAGRTSGGSAAAASGGPHPADADRSTVRSPLLPALAPRDRGSGLHVRAVSGPGDSSFGGVGRVRTRQGVRRPTDTHPTVSPSTSAKTIRLRTPWASRTSSARSRGDRMASAGSTRTSSSECPSSSTCSTSA